MIQCSFCLFVLFVCLSVFSGFEGLQLHVLNQKLLAVFSLMGGGGGLNVFYNTTRIVKGRGDDSGHAKMAAALIFMA